MSFLLSINLNFPISSSYKTLLGTIGIRVFTDFLIRYQYRIRIAMTNFITVITALISATATIIVACISKNVKDQTKRSEEEQLLRAKEAKLQLKMQHANSKLTVGVAMALKRGHCNGEVEEGLRAVNEADAEYSAFLENIAIEHIKK